MIVVVFGKIVLKESIVNTTVVVAMIGCGALVLVLAGVLSYEHFYGEHGRQLRVLRFIVYALLFVGCAYITHDSFVRLDLGSFILEFYLVIACCLLAYETARQICRGK